MDVIKSLLPSLKAHFVWSLLVCLLCCAFLLALVWQKQQILMASDLVPFRVLLCLSLSAVAGLLGSIILWVRVWRLPDYQTTGKSSPQRVGYITRLLRADAYSYLLLPLTVLALLAWEQVGNIILLGVILLLAQLFFKIFFLIKFNKLLKK